MIHVGMVVEGKTEGTFVAEVLRPHLAHLGIYPEARLITTNLHKHGRQFKGGIVSYDRFKKDVKALLANPNFRLVTTMIDYFGLPDDFPGQQDKPKGTKYAQVAHLEEALREDIGNYRFLPYLSLHEFEAILFVDPAQIGAAFPGKDVTQELCDIKSRFKSPEEIDDKEPPSHRIVALVESYQKVLDGNLIALQIGLDRIRAECSHFDQWVKQLEELGGQ